MFELVSSADFTVDVMDVDVIVFSLLVLSIFLVWIGTSFSNACRVSSGLDGVALDIGHALAILSIVLIITCHTFHHMPDR